MGRKTVRWSKLQEVGITPGWTCTSCQNMGIMQKWDEYGTYYAFCTCYYGQKQKQEMEIEHKSNKKAE